MISGREKESMHSVLTPEPVTLLHYSMIPVWEHMVFCDSIHYLCCVLSTLTCPAEFVLPDSSRIIYLPPNTLGTLIN